MSNQCFRRIYPSETPSTMSEKERALVQVIAQTKMLIEEAPNAKVRIGCRGGWMYISNDRSSYRMDLSDGSEITGFRLSFSMVGNVLMFTLGGPWEPMGKSISIASGDVGMVQFIMEQEETTLWEGPL